MAHDFPERLAGTDHEAGGTRGKIQDAPGYCVLSKRIGTGNVLSFFLPSLVDRLQGGSTQWSSWGPKFAGIVTKCQRVRFLAHVWCVIRCKVERDAHCQAVIRARQSESLLGMCPIQSDVQGWRPSTAAGWKAQAILGGFPCQVQASDCPPAAAHQIHAMQTVKSLASLPRA